MPISPARLLRQTSLPPLHKTVPPPGGFVQLWLLPILGILFPTINGRCICTVWKVEGYQQLMILRLSVTYISTTTMDADNKWCVMQKAVFHGVGNWKGPSIPTLSYFFKKKKSEKWKRNINKSLLVRIMHCCEAARPFSLRSSSLIRFFFLYICKAYNCRIYESFA